MVLIPVVFQLLFIAALNIPVKRFSHDLDSMRMGKKILFAMQENEIDVSKMIWLLMVSGPAESMSYMAAYHEKVQTERKWTAIEKSTDPELLRLARKGKHIWDQMQDVWLLGTGSSAASGNVFEWMRIGGSKKAFSLYKDQRALMREILDLEQRKVAQQPEEIEALRNSLVILLWIGFGISCLISVALMFFFTGDIVNRLTAIAAKAQLLTFGKPVPVESTGSDEIAQLEKTISATSLKLVEARQRQAVILDNSADVICSLDAKLKFSAVGEAASKIWGLTSDELLGKSVLTLLAAETIDSTRVVLERIAQTTGEGQVENVVRCKDGTLKNSIWTVLWSPEKRAYFCVVHDVTALRNVEKLKQHFISVASHDLRAPLTSVMLNVSILTESMDEELPPGIVDELNRVQNSAQRLTGLVNELLELDKLEAGRLDVELERVFVSDACQAAADLLFGMARQSGVTISLPDSDAIVLAEEKRLVQMISNLLSNAIKFSPEKGKIEILVSSDKHFARISVKDHGCGMTAKECATIFEKFSQAGSSRTTGIKGTGLGLAVVKALAESHGGGIGVESEPGKGTTFTLSIPLAPPVDATEVP